MKTNSLYRRTIVAACIILIALSVPSCKKYLDVQPVSSFGTDYVFSTIGNAQKAVLGAYASMTGDNGYGIRISMYFPYDEDLMMGQGGTPYPDNERRDIAHYNLNANNTQLTLPFNQLYNGIERANVCIYNIPLMPQYASGSDADKNELKRLHGEALTLRAQFYLELIRNWGDVPAQFQHSAFETDLFKGKTDRDSIYNKLLDDLLLAETLVPWRTQVTRDERITQGAVRALRARIALYRSGYSLRRNPRVMARGSNHLAYYQIAKDECATIMARTSDHTLNPSYQAVFKNYICAHAIEPNGEVVFEIAMGGGTSGLGDSKLGYYNGPQWNGTGNGALTILPNYFYLFDSTDTRRDVMCAPYNTRRSGAGIDTVTGRTLQTVTDGKFRRDWTSNPSLINTAAQYMGLNWPVIRFSDVLLMFAEADNEINNGPTAAAYEAINKVRRRAYGKPINTPDATVDLTGLSKSTFFDAIVKERGLELGGEGIRKYDLIRWNLLTQKIADTKALLAVMSARSAAPWNTYPTTMYLKNNATTVQYPGSFYKPTVTPTPPTGSAGYHSVSWLGTGITSTILTYYAIAFQANHSELLPLPQAAIDGNPNLKQDYGY